MSENQKIMDKLFGKFSEVFAFTDDILFIAKGTKRERLSNVRELLHSPNPAKIPLKATKCKFAKDKIQ